ncbi:cytochrome b562 [Poriferisphaera sp. WC338]|uniref:cytochrome b562 n=1 Tax=Poriferisphaera sp. WC338 TaxID=3425129 RepID=UPI003D816A6C
MPKEQNFRARFGLMIFVTLGSLALLAPLSFADKDSEHDEVNLHELMEDMEDDFKALRKQINNADKNDSSVELLTDLQEDAVEAKGFMPDNVLDASASEKDALQTEYLIAMNKLIIELAQTEIALLENDNKKAVKALVKVRDVQRSGHKKFKHD